MTWHDLGLSHAVRLLVFLALAACLLVLQVDKASEERAIFANLVPPGLGGFADFQIARSSLEQRPAETKRRLDALLRYRPTASSHLSLFAIWAAEREDPRAGEALTLAAQRGWRDRYTQLTVLASAVEQGKIEVAAARLDALARMRIDQQAIAIALTALLQSDGGQEAVAQRMVESDFLMRRFVAYARTSPSISPEIVATFEKAAALHPNLSCDVHGNLATVALRSGNPDYVAGVWPRRCGTIGSMDLVFDLSKRDDSSQPFAWRFPRLPGLSVRTGRDKGSITVINRDPIRRTFARRFLTLPAGDYLLEISTPGPSVSTLGSRSATVALTAHCVAATPTGRPGMLEAEGKGNFAFRVPEGCPIQMLQVVATRGTAENVVLKLGKGRLADNSNPATQSGG